MARVGVFVCWCGANIAETVDCEDVARYGDTLPDVVISQSYKYMCSDPGQRLIVDAIKEHDLSAVVVAACSPRMHEPTYRATVEKEGFNPYMLEMANIREHCSWVHTNRHDATEKARDLIRLLVEKVKRNVPLDRIKVPVTQRALVIGAGIAGIQAALNISAAGYEVVLVERQPSIGGYMAMLDETFPTLDCSQCILTPRMVEITQSENITLHTYSEIEQVDGYVGNFEVKIRNKARSVDHSKCTGCGDCWNNCVAQNKLTIPEKVSVAPRTPPEVAATVDAIIAQYENPLGMIIGALQDIQDAFNYLRRDAMCYFSEKAGVPLSRLYAMARFYGAFSLKPRGKNIIRVCVGTACHMRGAGNIADAVTRELGIQDGETTKDKMFTLESVFCLGACARAPIVTVNDEYYGNMTIAKMMKVIEERYKGESIEPPSEIAAEAVPV